jgi:hypothetical protein
VIGNRKERLMNKDYCKEDIGKIIRAERRPENYFENTSNQYARFEMAMLFGETV